ncbi:hypothetical protein Q9233_006515 [Columba guinea]|nr:hypothetical protein Q9233_006515 [Columba guinea]
MCHVPTQQELEPLDSEMDAISGLDSTGSSDKDGVLAAAWEDAHLQLKDVSMDRGTSLLCKTLMIKTSTMPKCLNAAEKFEMLVMDG